MEDETDRLLDRARELLDELQRPDAYTVLGATRDTPSSKIHAAYMQAVRIQAQTGHPGQESASARAELMDAHKRLVIDSQSLDLDDWLRELDALRNRYALYDFVADLRKS